ncbi:MAG TPA: ribonuclease E activity regulator RraA [Gemmatimonadales bacterium]|nr:ribonuclease E activity regulator RraA [Gemmatimonadales bacterium]
MAFATADLCDEFGAEVLVAEPLFRDWGGVVAFAGRVETLRVFEDNALVRAVLESPGRGAVLVVDGGGSLRSALVGGNLAALAHAQGWSGLVVHGCIRDAAEIAGTPLGVKALHAVPRKSAKSGAGERGVAVTFAGVTFSPGAHLYADRDGIVLASRDLLAR